MITFGITFLIVGVGANSQFENYRSKNPYQMPPSELSKYVTSQSPLIIENDGDLISLNLDGSGTIDDPFLLENLDLTSESSHLIVISDISFALTIQNNFLNGVTGEYNGIVLQRVDNIRIQNNMIVQTDTGIQLNSSSNNVISNNSISSNTGYAIELYGRSNLNLIVWNNIIQNSQSTSNAFDEGLQNVFQNNFWEEQSKQDNNGDQINDHPYNIDGEMGNSDLTPLIGKYDSTKHQHSPIQLLGPYPSELRIGLVKVQWTPSLDSHGHSVKYSLYFSSNSNSSWTMIKDQLQVNSYNWNTTGLVEDQYNLKIVVTDDLDLTTETIFESGFYLNEFVSVDPSDNGSKQSIGTIEGFQLLSLIIFFVMFIGFGGYKVLKRISNRAFKINVLEGLLGITATPVMLQIISGDESEVEEYDIIPPELLKFKFLLNPVRLGIMKILYDYSQIAAYELRDLIGISWGKFTPHIDSLIDKGLLSSSSDFIDGKPRKIIFIEEIGRGQFMELQLILRKFAN